MTYKNWKPGSRRDRRGQAGGSRSRRRVARSSNMTIYIVIGIFAALLIALLVALTIATR